MSVAVYSLYDSGPADLLGLPRRIASTEYDGWLRGGMISDRHGRRIRFDSPRFA